MSRPTKNTEDALQFAMQELRTRTGENRPSRTRQLLDWQETGRK